MWYYGHMGYFGWLWMIVFWVAFIWFVVWLIRKGTEAKEESAEDILKMRYAKGDITKKEFDEMKKELR